MGDSARSRNGSDSTHKNRSGERKPFSRRRFIGGISAATVGLAGCLRGDDDSDGGDGDGGDDDDELGERVPTITVNYWPDADDVTAYYEAILPEVQSDAEDALGVDIELIPQSFSSAIEGIFNDSRQFHFGTFRHGLDPTRLDPHELTWRFNILWAGANGAGNPPNYANCEYSELAHAQAQAPSIEERQQLVTDAHSIMSEEVATIPITNVVRYGAYATNNVVVEGTGRSGLHQATPIPLIESSTSDGSPLIASVSPFMLETPNYLMGADTGMITQWGSVFYSQLVMYDENYELQPILAETYSVEEDGTRLTFELRDGATFHNGDPITSEDVKFTFEFISENSGSLGPQAGEIPFESIETPDERTTVFNFQEPYWPFLNRDVPRWGILPKDDLVNKGAEENPAEFDIRPVVGSGPYEITQFEGGQFIEAEPHDGHPVFQPENTLFWEAYDTSETAYSAFREGSINLLLTMDASIADRVRNEMADEAEIVVTDGYTNSLMYPQYSFGPTKFREFRMAFSQTIDRERANETAMFGDANPLLHSAPMTDAHPWYPGNENLTQIADAPNGSPERAKEVLEAEGWSWDEDGNLHFPVDADLSPRWPQGEEPADYPDEFPCVTELGEV